jgi:hypothetical protein
MPAPVSEANAGDEAVRVVRETLKGPVIQVMRRLVPDLAQVSPDVAYDHALANLGLLERCFKAFREQRDRFRHILVDKSGRVVDNDTSLLTCGHNLEVVVAMIVRTAAKRYFRNHIGLEQAPKFLSAQPKLLDKMRKVLANPGNKKTLSEELYECIKGYLLFEWQVPLVPTYAKLTPAQVSTMGRKLLSYKDEVELAKATGLPVPISKAPPPKPALPPRDRAVASAPSRPAPRPMAPPLQPMAESKQSSWSSIEPPPQVAAQQPIFARPPQTPPIAAQSAALRTMPISTTQAPATGPRSTQQPGGKKLSGASFADVLALPHVMALIDPILHGTNSIRIIDIVGARAWAALILTLGIRRKDQLAVLLLNAFGSLGPQEFKRVLGNDANPAILDQLLADVQSTDVNAESTLEGVIAFVAKTFTPQKTANLQ